MVKIGYVGPDWVENFTKHVICRGPIALIDEINALDEDVQVFRVTRPHQMNEADAIILFHHSHAGYQLYESDNYTQLINVVLDEWDKPQPYHKIVWHVEPIARYTSTVSQVTVRNADILMHTLCNMYLAKYLSCA